MEASSGERETAAELEAVSWRWGKRRLSGMLSRTREKSGVLFIIGLETSLLCYPALQFSIFLSVNIYFLYPLQIGKIPPVLSTSTRVTLWPIPLSTRPSHHLTTRDFLVTVQMGPIALSPSLPVFVRGR